MEVVAQIVVFACFIVFMVLTGKSLKKWQAEKMPVTVMGISYALACLVFLINGRIPFPLFFIFFIGVPIAMLPVALLLYKKSDAVSAADKD